MDKARGASSSSRDTTTTGRTLPSNPKFTMKTSPTFGVIEFAPDFVPSLNVQQVVVFGSIQPDRHLARPGDFTDENANHLGGGSAERFGDGIGLGQQGFFNPATKKHSHAPT